MSYKQTFTFKVSTGNYTIRNRNEGVTSEVDFFNLELLETKIRFYKNGKIKRCSKGK